MLMSTNCHSCGYRDTEIKSGGAISTQAKKIVLQVEDEEDLKRDILKSDTSEFHIPEIGLELNPGTLGGRFTTLEGLLNQVYEELDSRVFAKGDSAKPGSVDAMEVFLGKLKQVRSVPFRGSKVVLLLKQAMTAEIPFTVILDDPLANCYIQNPFAPDDDPKMTTELYERTFQQNEELGLNDIQVEGYEGEEEAKRAALEAEGQA
jgi:zinc finger protein